MPRTSKQLWLPILLFAVIAVGVSVAYQRYRAGDIQMAEAQQAFKAERFDLAEAAYARATQVAPNNAEAWYWLGISRRNQGLVATAADALSKATELDDSHTVWWIACAETLQWSKRFAEAEKAWQRALDQLKPKDGQLKPKDGRMIEIQINMARSIASQGEIDRAQKLLEDLLAVQDDPQIRSVLAELLAGAGRFEESANQYRKALQQ